MAHIIYFIPFLFSFAFAQEGAIKFQIPLDSASKPAAAAQPPKQEPPKISTAAGKPLNLAELSTKDTASFDTYSKRYALVQDSISAAYREIEATKKRVQAQMPTLKPKDEYEKQAEYDARKTKWEKEFEELTKRNTKVFTDRLAELEKAKKKVMDNQASLYGSVDIKSNPSAVSIWLGKEEIGTTPAEYSLLIPGAVKIILRKEGYEPWDTTLQVTPGAKLKLNATLEEKSIFSKEGEINLHKILAKDTTAAGYRKRISTVKARIKQTDEEMKTLLENFSDKYPALEPQKPNETTQDFEKRQTAWQNEGIKQVGILKQKHSIYKGRLTRSIKVLEDNIIADESRLIAETLPIAYITLGAYDVEKEIFEITIQDTANAKTPFHFTGKIGVPRDTAKAMNRSTEGFIANISYINYPFVYKDSSFNLAMKDISLSRKAVPLKAEGEFKRLSKFDTMEGYGAWYSRANFLLSGVLKPQGLGLDYALKSDKAKEAATEAAEMEEDWEGESGKMGWRGWTRIAAFTAMAVCGAFAIDEHSKLKDYKNKFNAINKTQPKTNVNGEYDDWYNSNRNELERNMDNFNDNKLDRDILGIGAGVFAISGILTFVF